MTPEIKTLCDEIAETLREGVDADAVKAWIYAELLEDSGHVAVYHEKPDGVVCSRSRCPEDRLESVLLSQIAELRRLWTTSGGPAWTVASHCWERPILSIQFGNEDVTDARGMAARRGRWEKRHFGKREISSRDC